MFYILIPTLKKAYKDRRPPNPRAEPLAPHQQYLENANNTIEGANFAKLMPETQPRQWDEEKGDDIITSISDEIKTSKSKPKAAQTKGNLNYIHNENTLSHV